MCLQMIPTRIFSDSLYTGIKIESTSSSILKQYIVLVGKDNTVCSVYCIKRRMKFTQKNLDQGLLSYLKCY